MPTNPWTPVRLYDIGDVTERWTISYAFLGGDPRCAFVSAPMDRDNAICYVAQLLSLPGLLRIGAERTGLNRPEPEVEDGSAT